MNALPPMLASKLADFRSRVWTVKLVEGLLAGLLGLMLSYLLVLVLDRLIETPSGWRWAILLAGAAVLGVGLPLKWHRWVWRQRRLEDAARLLRHRFPRLGDQLLGIVELARMESGATGRSERLVAAAMEQADEEVRERDFTDAVPQARHRRWAAVCASAVLVIGAAVWIAPQAAGNAFQRWIRPWAPIERFTFARVEPLPDPLVVPLAESVPLELAMTPESRWQPTRAVGSLEGLTRLQAERESGEVFTLDLPPLKRDTALNLRVGDARLRTEVQPRARPEMTALTATLKLPDYLEYETEPQVEVRGGTLSLLQGAEVRFRLEAARAIESGSVFGKQGKVQTGALHTGWRPVVGDELAEFSWTDELGLTPREDLALQLRAVEDQAPRVVARKEATEQVVLDTEVLRFELSASDDFGVKTVGLAWDPLRADPNTPGLAAKGGKIVAAGAAEMTQWTGPATFCAAREGIAPQSLELYAWVEDYLPERPRSESARFVLHILNATDHALWLTQQMGKWLDVARESYEREQQLHQTNKELRELSAAELDQPQNRRRVAQQASSEQANAQRLDNLNQAGRKLVEQAMKNPEFDAERLEAWAEMLQSLNDIAKNRMPSVADLLKESAGAKADAAPSPTMAQNEGDSGENASRPSGSEAASSEADIGESPKAPSMADTESGPTVAEGPEAPSKGGEAAPEQDPDQPSVPGIQLTDAATTEAEGEGPEGSKKPGGPGRVSLPTNQLGSAGEAGEQPASPEEATSAAQQKLDDGIWEQRDLLEEFASVADQLGELLASLEASTFVKRLKAASQEQWTLATELQRKTLSTFGLTPPPEIEPAEEEESEPVLQEVVEEAPPPPSDGEADPAAVEEDPAEALARSALEDARELLANRSTEQSEVVRVIQSDLNAYTQRRPDQTLRRVLGEMRETQVTRELKQVGEKTRSWLSGHAIVGAEFWADTLDRWAEELVPVAEGCNCQSTQSADSLPPEIVLKVMQALQDEMQLREETRELENAKPALSAKEHQQRAFRLSGEQSRIAIEIQSASDQLARLPNSMQNFSREMKLLGMVRHVMDEVVGLLDQPETGDPTVAAETEAIELLLRSQRPPPDGGGGGGGGNPGGGGGGSTSTVALSELGPGGAAQEQTETRQVGQSTGRAGREFPPEFQSGLDAYFNNLEAGAEE